MSDVLTVYYWPMMGRAGPIVRMLEHANIPYAFKSEFGEGKTNVT
jgi:hypothetical protein